MTAAQHGRPTLVVAAEQTLSGRGVQGEGAADEVPTVSAPPLTVPHQVHAGHRLVDVAGELVRHRHVVAAGLGCRRHDGTAG